MARPRFAEMLVDRRRQLGLSITQASQVLRLKEQVLIAFEEGDFERIPKSGYAQGMLASYARYLGLNSRQVVNQFSSDLYEYAGSAGRGSRGSDASSDAGYSSAGPYVESHGLLPTSGGLAGDMGAFSTTSQPHSRSQATPLVNSRRYVGTAGRSNESAVDGALNNYYGQGLSGAQGMSTYRTRGSRPQRSYGYDGGRDQMTTRRGVPNGYEGGYDDEGLSDDRAHTRRASRSASGNQASRARRRNATTQRSRRSRQGGLLEPVINFMSDGRRAMAVLLCLVALAAVVGIVFAVRGCSSTASTTSDKTVPVTSADETKSTDGKTSTTNGSQDANAKGDGTSKTDGTATQNGTANQNGNAQQNGTATQNSNANQNGNAQQNGNATQNGNVTQNGTGTQNGAAATGTQNTAQQTRVVVTVDSGMVSWVDIQCDGESKVADTVTGPWSQTYDVHEAIVIEVGDTAAVTVTENGVRRQFDSKTSGIGSITIQGTPLPSNDQKKTDGSNNQQQNQDQGTNQQQNAEEPTEAETEDTSYESDDYGFSGDESAYVYTYDGYDIYYDSNSGIYYFIDESGAVHNAADGSVIG